MQIILQLFTLISVKLYRLIFIQRTLRLQALNPKGSRAEG